jgi:hypothetical protein
VQRSSANALATFAKQPCSHPAREDLIQQPYCTPFITSQSTTSHQLSPSQLHLTRLLTVDTRPSAACMKATYLANISLKIKRDKQKQSKPVVVGAPWKDL